MSKKCCLLTCLISVYLLLNAVSIKEIEDNYFEGSLHSNHIFLRINVADNKDLAACKLFYSAKTSKNIVSVKQFYQSSYQKDPQSIYGQKSLLELAKIEYLNRDFDSALSYLSKINLLFEKYYWQARIYYIQNKISSAIISANNFINKSNDEPLISDISCILLDIYQLQVKSKEFSDLKTNLSKRKNYEDYEAYVLYKEACLYERQQNYSEAIEVLKLIPEKYPKSQYRVLADDLAIELNKKTFLNNKSPDLNEKISQPEAPKVQNNKLLSLNNLDKSKAYLQYALFSTQKAAEIYKSQLEDQGLSPFIITKSVNDKIHYALIQGPFVSKTEATKFFNQIKNNNINGFIFIP